MVHHKHKRVFIFAFTVLMIFSLASVRASNMTGSGQQSKPDNASSSAVAKSLTKTADQYQKEEKYREAIEYHEKALKIYQLNSDALSEAGALFNIGRCYSYMFEFDKSTVYLIKAMKLFEAQNNLVKISETLNSLGVNYGHCLNREKAVDCYLKSYEISKKLKDDKTSSNVLNNIGSVYLTGLKDYSKALYYFRKSLAISEKLDDSTHSIQMENIALTYLGMKKYDTALMFFTTALKSSERYNLKIGIASNCCNIANLYLKINKPEEAKLFLDRSLTVSMEINSKGLVRVVYNLYTLFYAVKGDIAKMWEYADRSDAITDTLYNEEGKKNIADMQTKYETEKKEQEIEILSIENKLKESKLRSNSFLLIGLTIALTFSAIFILQKRRLFFAHRTLVKKNLEIVASESKLNNLFQKDTFYKNATGENPESHAIKYISSQLSEEQKLLIKNLIINYFNSSNHFLKQDYSIYDLANDLEINRNYISQVVNEKFSRNFNSLLNEYRIKEARKILSESSNHRFTIESIAESVGYKSKTTFNNAFKKYVGVTPSFYLESMKNHKD